MTGGAGFIGSHLVDRLIGADHDVWILDNLTTGTMKNLSDVVGSQNLRIACADIRRIRRSLLMRIGRVDRVCHLAAVTSVQDSIKDPVLTSDVNLIGTLRVLDVARRLRAERVVVASSAAVYGTPTTSPTSEDAELAPVNPYGASKAASDLYCQAFEENHGTEVVSLRYFNVYGPRQISSQYSGVISIFAKRLLRRLPLPIFGDGLQSRDFVFVKDVVDATMLALEKPLRSRVFNIGTGTETTILNLARIMREAVGLSSDLRFHPPRIGDSRGGMADISKARDELGFIPTTSLRDGLSTTLRWYQQNRRS